MRRYPTLREVGKIFTGDSTKEEIVAAGEKVFATYMDVALKKV